MWRRRRRKRSPGRTWFAPRRPRPRRASPTPLTAPGAAAAGAGRGGGPADEITLFKSVGLAVQDAVAAGAILRRAEAEGLGQVIDLYGLYDGLPDPLPPP